MSHWTKGLAGKAWTLLLCQAFLFSNLASATPTDHLRPRDADQNELAAALSASDGGRVLTQADVPSEPFDFAQGESRDGGIKDRIKKLFSSVPSRSPEETLDVVLKGLQDKDWLVRSDAVRELGKSRSPDVLGWLRLALEDEHWMVRLEAVSALEEINPTDISSLTKALTDEESQIRMAAAEALGRKGDAASTRLLETVAQYDKSSFVREYALRAVQEAHRRLGQRPARDGGAADGGKRISGFEAVSAHLRSLPDDARVYLLENGHMNSRQTTPPAALQTVQQFEGQPATNVELYGNPPTVKIIRFASDGGASDGGNREDLRSILRILKNDPSFVNRNPSLMETLRESYDVTREELGEEIAALELIRKDARDGGEDEISAEIARVKQRLAELGKRRGVAAVEEMKELWNQLDALQTQLLGGDLEEGADGGSRLGLKQFQEFQRGFPAFLGSP